MNNLTIAERIKDLPFYTACREADQLCIKSKTIENDTIWRFTDGSQLTSYMDENRLEIL